MIVYNLHLLNKTYNYLKRKKMQTKAKRPTLPSMSIDEIRSLMQSAVSLKYKITTLRKAGFRQFEIDNIIFAYMQKDEQQPDAWVQLINDMTYGIEIEAYNVDPFRVVEELTENGVYIRRENYNHTNNNRFYKIVTDSSIQGSNGLEVVSPVLKGAEGFDSLKKVCKTLQTTGANINKSCGLHVHIGARNFSLKQIKNIYINYSRLESLIDSFMPISRRKSNNSYCRSIKQIRNFEMKIDNCSDTYEISNVFQGDRYYKINAQSFSRHQTIEFRQHSGTIDFEKIENWVNFLRRLVAFSENNRLTADVTNVNEVPFLSEKEKVFFEKRAQYFARLNETTTRNENRAGISDEDFDRLFEYIMPVDVENNRASY